MILCTRSIVLVFSSPHVKPLYLNDLLVHTNFPSPGIEMRQFIVRPTEVSGVRSQQLVPSESYNHLGLVFLRSSCDRITDYGGSKIKDVLSWWGKCWLTSRLMQPAIYTTFWNNLLSWIILKHRATSMYFLTSCETKGGKLPPCRLSRWPHALLFSRQTGDICGQTQTMPTQCNDRYFSYSSRVWILVKDKRTLSV